MNNGIFYSDPVVASFSSEELSRILRDNMGSNTHELRSSLLVLLSYSIYMTYEEVYSLHPVSSHVITELNNLISKGYVVKKEFGQAVGTCSIFFAITLSGFDEARKRCIGYLPVRYKYGRKPAAYIHTYYAGYNLFQILKLPFRFAWEREYLGDSYDYKKDFKKRILQVDALCTLEPSSEHQKKLYIEEDTGSEAFSILLGKMENYNELSYMSVHSIDDKIIFSCVDDAASFRQPRGDGPNPFNEKKVGSLISYMSSNGYTDARQVLNGSSSKEELFALKLLETVGAVFRMDDGSFKNSSLKVDEEFLRDYRKKLVHLRSPYLLGKINLKHLLVSMRRLHSLSVEAVNGYRTHRWVYPLSRGYQVLCVPTPLLADRLRYSMLSSFEEIQMCVCRALSSYFGNIVFRKDLSDDIFLSNGGSRYKSIRLRNVFSYEIDGKDGLLAVEMPFIDVGAWVRCFLFSRYYEGKAPVNIVCVFENSYQAEMFYRLLGYSYTNSGVELAQSGIFGIDLLQVRGLVRPELYVMNDFSNYKEKRTFLPLFK